MNQATQEIQLRKDTQDIQFINISENGIFVIATISKTLLLMEEIQAIPGEILKP